MKNKNYHSNIAFLDLFLNALVGFVFLFLVSWLLINPVAKNKTVDAKGEFLIVAEWDYDSSDDVDLWVKDPHDRIVHYANKDTSLLHLDRDDLGTRNDSIVNPDGSKTEIQLNREVVTIRGISPGEYIVNVHMYRKEINGKTVNIKVEIIKINPFSIIVLKNIQFSDPGQEATILRFTLDDDGNVINKSDLFTSLLERIGFSKAN